MSGTQATTVADMPFRMSLKCATWLLCLDSAAVCRAYSVNASIQTSPLCWFALSILVAAAYVFAVCSVTQQCSYDMHLRHQWTGKAEGSQQ